MTIDLIGDLYHSLPWRWVWVAGWVATFLLTIYPLGNRRLDRDDLIRFGLLSVLWLPFLIAVGADLRQRGAGASPPAAAPLRSTES